MWFVRTEHFSRGGTVLPNSTGLSKRNGAKFSELSQNFPKLADKAVHGSSLCLAALGAEFSNRGHFFCTTLYNTGPYSKTKAWPSFAPSCAICWSLCNLGQESRCVTPDLVSRQRGQECGEKEIKMSVSCVQKRERGREREREGEVKRP